MSELLFKSFQNISQQEKELVLKWRNSDNVRFRMNNQEIIALNDHLQWIKSLNGRKDCIYYLVYIDGHPFGVVNHVKMDFNERSATGGVYVGDSAYTGYGIPICYYGFYDIFENFNLKIFRSNVLKSNPRVYKMHRKIFHAKDFNEDNNEYYIYFDIES